MALFQLVFHDSVERVEGHEHIYFSLVWLFVSQDILSEIHGFFFILLHQKVHVRVANTFISIPITPDYKRIHVHLEKLTKYKKIMKGLSLYKKSNSKTVLCVLLCSLDSNFLLISTFLALLTKAQFDLCKVWVPSYSSWVLGLISFF